MRPVLSKRTSLGILAVAVAGASLALPWTSSDAAEPPGPAVDGAAGGTAGRKPVVVATPSPGHAQSVLRFSGVTEAKRSAELSFTVPGRLDQRGVDVGSTVKANEVLAVLDRRAAKHRVSRARAGLRQAEAQVQQSKRDQARADMLTQSGAGAAIDSERADHAAVVRGTSMDAAAVEVADAKRAHTDGVLRAPFDGTVVEVHVEVGEFVGVGRSVATLHGGGLEVEFRVPETVVAALRVGDHAALEMPLQPGVVVDGHIASIGHGGAGSGDLFPVRIDMRDAQSVLPGMTVDWLLTRDGEDGMRVPVSSIVSSGDGGTAVFVVEYGPEGATAARRAVEVGELLGDHALVLRGLDTDDRVVSGGQFGLVPGQAVEPRQ